MSGAAQAVGTSRSLSFRISGVFADAFEPSMGARVANDFLSQEPGFTPDRALLDHWQGACPRIATS